MNVLSGSFDNTGHGFCMNYFPFGGWIKCFCMQGKLRTTWRIDFKPRSIGSHEVRTHFNGDAPACLLSFVSKSHRGRGWKFGAIPCRIFSRCGLSFKSLQSPMAGLRYISQPKDVRELFRRSVNRGHLGQKCSHAMHASSVLECFAMPHEKYELISNLPSARGGELHGACAES